MSVLLPNEDQLALAQGVQAFLSGRFPLQRFRTKGDTDCDRWPELAELGVFGLSLPESQGGLGLTWLDEILACREAGRFLLSPALIGSILATRIAAIQGDNRLRQALLSGERYAGIATTSSTGLCLVDGASSLFVMLEANAICLAELDPAAMSETACIDDAVSLHHTSSSPEIKARLVDTQLVLGANLLAAAMLCGVLEASCEMAAEYARSRVQFGRPIGAFQGIKHRCADMALATELCWSQVLQATQALENQREDAAFHVLSAKWLAGQETLKATRFNIQAHGGMGFTDEVDAHRLMKRCHVLHQMFADPRTLPSTLLTLQQEAQA